MRLNLIVIATVSLILNGCGGSVDYTTNTAEGFWMGTTNTGSTMALVDMDVGQTFGMSTANGEIQNGLYGGVVGIGSDVHGGSGKDFNFTNHTISSITYAGTASIKSALTLSTSSNLSFTGLYRQSYDQPVTVAQIAGTYSGVGIAGVTSTPQSMSVTIGSDGAVTVTGIDCVGTTTMTPRAGGKNVFNVRINFSGGSCVLGDGATTIGVVILDQNVVPARAYIMSVINDASDGFYWTGT
jgi:hypothetical protein